MKKQYENNNFIQILVGAFDEKSSIKYFSINEGGTNSLQVKTSHTHNFNHYNL